MSLSPIVDQRYRLKPTDIGQATLRVTIQNVSFQGVEELKPVLHLVEFPTKRFVVDRAQCQALIRLTGSPLLLDWIGHQIDLKTITAEEQTNILIAAPQAAHWPWQQVQSSTRAGNYQPLWTSILLLIVLLLIFGAAYALDNGDLIGSLIKNFFTP